MIAAIRSLDRDRSPFMRISRAFVLLIALTILTPLSRDSAEAADQKPTVDFVGAVLTELRGLMHTAMVLRSCGYKKESDAVGQLVVVKYEAAIQTALRSAEASGTSITTVFSEAESAAHAMAAYQQGYFNALTEWKTFMPKYKIVCDEALRLSRSFLKEGTQ
jgi:hypothetical protein